MTNLNIKERKNTTDKALKSLQGLVDNLDEQLTRVFSIFKLNRGNTMKNTNARITGKTEKFLSDHFRTKSAGAEYILAATPAVMRKFIGIDTKGRFTASELKLMIDVMNGTMLSPEMAGQHLPLNVTDGIMLDHLDEKWGVDAAQLNRTLACMSTPELMILEIWIQGFWKAVTNHDQDLDEYIQVAL